MLIVVARPVPHVRGEVRGEPLLAVPLHEIDDVVRYERWEPAHPIAHLVPRPDVRRRGDHHRDGLGIAAGSACPFTEQPDAPADEAWVGELDDRAIGDATGEPEPLGSISGDPHRQAGFWRPIEVELRAFRVDLAPFAQVAGP